MCSRLDGKTALVTGAASGIGRAAADLFAAEGARVIAVDREGDQLQAAAQGGVADRFACDVARAADLEALRDHVAATHGALDVLFANAGVATFAPLGEVDEAEFDRVAAVNFKGTFFTVQTLAPLLSDGASVILTASVSGFKGQAAFSVYSATKAAIRSLARTFTTDLKARRIRVNAISPGNIETPIGHNAGMSDAKNQEFYRQGASQTPLGRNGQAEDIARGALYLASDDSAFVAASELVVDGGFAQV